MIGAPLTAAFVGVLLAESDMVFGEALMPSAVTQGVGHGDAGGVGPGRAAVADGGQVGAAGVAGSSPGGDIGTNLAGLDLVSVEATATAGAAPAVSPQVTAAATPQASATVGAKASITAGPSVAINFAGSPGDTAGASIDSAAAAGAGTLGISVTGGADGDVIHGTEFDDHLSGGDGDDLIYGHDGDDLLDGGRGDDQLYGGAGDDDLLGGLGNDQLHGGVGDDDLLGGAGNDRLYGDAGRDRLDGGAGADRLDGGTGADLLQGGTGNDILLVDQIHDVALENGRGADGGGADLLVIGEDYAASLPDGNDDATFVYSDHLGIDLPDGAADYREQVGPEIEHLTFQGTADFDAIGDNGDNWITGNAGDNRLYGRGGDDHLGGGQGADLLDGGIGRDELTGGGGDDLLLGQAGQDVLFGGGGDDFLDGGLGADLLYGQQGNDTFAIGLNDSAVDTVFDHEGTNQIVLSDAGDRLVETGVAGDDLYVVVDKNPVAVVEGYVGNEDALAGIDAGHGLTSIDALMAPNAGSGPARAAPDPIAAAPEVDAADDLLGGYVNHRSYLGGSGADTLRGSSEPDWLTGNAGDDQLYGNDGADVLEGGGGSDLLQGGAGNDHYLFRAGEAGLDTIRDAEGSNTAELDGFTGARLEGAVVGDDLVVVANYAPIFAVEGWVNHQEAFAGVQLDDQFVATDELFN